MLTYFRISDVKRAGSCAAFLVCSILVLGSWQNLSGVLSSPIFTYSNFLFFCALFISFPILLIFSFRPIVQNSTSSSKLYFSAALVLSILLVFLLQGWEIQGRFRLFPLYLTDFFEARSLFDYAEALDQRTFYKVFNDFLQYAFKINLDPDKLLLINKLYSVGILLSLYGLAVILTGNYAIGFLTVLTFSSSGFAQNIFSSIEYGVPALFFVVFSFFVLGQFVHTGKLIFLYLAILSDLLAGYFRYELALLFSLPFFVFLTLFYPAKRKLSLALLCLVYIARVIPILAHMISGTDVYIHGKSLNKGFWALFENIPDIWRNNFIVMRDFNLESGVITIFTFLQFIILPGLIWYLISNYRKNKLIPRWTLFIFCLVTYSVLHFGSIVSFHMEGLRSGVKYAIYFFGLEVVAVYAIISQWFQGQKWKASAACLVIFTICYCFSPLLNLIPAKNQLSFEYREYLILKNIPLNRECNIVKLKSNQPLISHYFPQQFTTYYFDDLVKPRGCYYYLEEKYLSYLIYDNPVKINPSEVFSHFPGCTNQRIEDHSLFSLWQIFC